MVILGLGSNIGDRRQYLSQAIERISEFVEQLALSHVFESEALLPQDAPAEWNQPFLNMAVKGVTACTPQELLVRLKAVERDMGRQVRGFWGPREIDIDILAMGTTVIDTPELIIPHAELLKRDFALLPLVNIAPDWLYPMQGNYHGWTAERIAAACGFKSGTTLKDIGPL